MLSAVDCCGLARCRRVPAYTLGSAPKARRYRWSLIKRCWYIDLDEGQLEIEHGYLGERIYQRGQPALRHDRFGARDRYSARVNPDLLQPGP